MRGATALGAATALVVVALVGTVPAVTAEVPAHAAACTTTQLTDSEDQDPPWFPGIWNVSMDGAATKVAFSSWRDLTGANTDGSEEVFLYDIASGTTAQVTDAPGDREVYKPHVWGPVLTTDGTSLAFVSDQDLLGANEDGNYEIYLHHVVSGALEQVTRTTVGSLAVGSGGSYVAANSSPAMNRDASRMVFNSTSRLDGSPAPPGVLWGYWLADRQAATFRPLPGPLSLDDTGTTAAQGGSQIYVRDVDTDEVTPLAGTEGGRWPVISGDGTRVAFTSDEDLVHENPDHLQEIFLHDRPSGTTTQLTDGGGLAGQRVVVSVDGTRVVFVSSADLTGENPSRTLQVFLRDTSTGTLDQVSGPGPAFDPAIDDRANSIAFVSPGDPVGRNPNGSAELFVVDCGAVPPRLRRQADALVRSPRAASFVGDDVYNGDGTGQTRVGRRRRGSVASFVVRVQNDGEAPDSFRLRGRPSPRGLRVRYLDGGDDVTTAVVDGRHTTGPLAPGEGQDLTAEVTVRHRATVGATRSVWVRVMPVGDDPRIDEVRVRTTIR